MSSPRKQRFATPDPVDLQEALAQSQQLGAQSLSFERDQFGEFFDVQSRLGEVLGQSLAPLGELPPSLQRAFEQNIAAAQSQRGLATSPLGAVDAAQKLAALSLQSFQATTGAAQQFQNAFRPSTGFAPTGTDFFQADLLRQQQESENKAALFNLREQRKFRESASKRQTFTQIAALGAGAFLGPGAGALTGLLGAGIGEATAPGFGVGQAGINVASSFDFGQGRQRQNQQGAFGGAGAQVGSAFGNIFSGGSAAGGGFGATGF